MPKPCTSSQIRNPITNRCIKIGGTTHKKLHADELKRMEEKMPYDKIPAAIKPCTRGNIRSPVSGRCIKIGGSTYTKLEAQGLLTGAVQPSTAVQPVVKKPCAKDYVRNPSTKRCIKIGGSTYKDLVKKGLLDIKSPRTPSHSIKTTIDEPIDNEFVDSLDSKGDDLPFETFSLEDCKQDKKFTVFPDDPDFSIEFCKNYLNIQLFETIEIEETDLKFIINFIKDHQIVVFWKRGIQFVLVKNNSTDITTKAIRKCIKYLKLKFNFQTTVLPFMIKGHIVRELGISSTKNSARIKSPHQNTPFASTPLQKLPKETSESKSPSKQPKNSSRPKYRGRHNKLGNWSTLR